jgi:hypothetical protein
MLNDKNLHFIKEKIQDLGIALFHCHSKGLLKIPNTVIQTLTVDDNGDILFFINRPKQQLSEFEQEFLVGLNYFKKGKDYFLNIFGKARIVNDPEELMYIPNLNEAEVTNALTTQVLIKVKILKVDFYGNEPQKKHYLISKAQTVLYSLLDWGQPGMRSFDFSTNSPLQHYGF